MTGNARGRLVKGTPSEIEEDEKDEQSCRRTQLEIHRDISHVPRTAKGIGKGDSRFQDSDSVLKALKLTNMPSDTGRDSRGPIEGRMHGESSKRVNESLSDGHYD